MMNYPDHPEPVDGLSFALVPHPETKPSQVRSVCVQYHMTDPDDILLTFKVEGSAELCLPEWRSAQRVDELWKTTCFEIFLLAADGRYFEFNLSPSTEWAAYSFISYRTDMQTLALDVEPHISFAVKPDTFTLEADLDLGQIPQGELKLALSAVIEERDGTKSYWALAHPPGQPDFHHPDCFALTLPPPGQS